MIFFNVVTSLITDLIFQIIMICESDLNLLNLNYNKKKVTEAKKIFFEIHVAV